MKKLLTATTGIMALSLTPVWAQFNPPATSAYATAAVEIWTEDESNQLVSMPSSFSCIIKNSRGDVNPNHTWEGLIDEADCGLDDSDNDQGGTQYARSIFTSTRASNTAPQNVTAWFDSTSGFKYIANVNVTSGPTDTNPVGEWTFAFYNAGTDGNTAPAASTDIGFVNIDETGGAVTITTASSFQDQSGLEEDAAIIKYNADDTVSFVGFRSNPGSEMAVAGKANDDYYYRVNITGIDIDAIRSGNLITGLAGASTNAPACYARTNPWQSVNRYALFTEQGERVNLSGAFGFETGASGTGDRGYMGNWGVWIDSETSSFSPTSTSLTIRADTGGDTPVARTLNWAPGKLHKLSTETEALANGTTYRTWAENNGSWIEVNAKYNAGSTRFDLFRVDNNENVGAIDQSVVTSDPWKARFWSPEKQTEVTWLVANANPDQISFELRTDVSKDSTILASGKELRSLYDGAPKAGLPITAASSARDNYSTGSANETYFLTSLSPSGSLEPRTLYIDNDGASGLTANDDPVRYDFSTSWSMLGQTYQSYSSANDNGDYSGFWPYESFKLYDPSDTDCSTPTDAACDHYEWSFGAGDWDHSIIANEQNGDLVTIDPPIFFDYTHAAANERNGNSSFAYETKDPNNPGAHTDTNSSGSFSVANSTFDNRKYSLEYDGNGLYGLPNVVIGDEDYGHWVSLINLKDGVQLTARDANSTTYRVKAVEISETLVKQSDVSNCTNANIVFTDPSSLGITLTDIPEPSDATLPTALWSELPADADLRCTVTHGDASDCTDAAN